MARMLSVFYHLNFPSLEDIASQVWHSFSLRPKQGLRILNTFLLAGASYMSDLFVRQKINICLCLTFRALTSALTL